MLGLRHLPLKYRLPLIHGTLNLLGRMHARTWERLGAKGSGEDGLQPGELIVSGFFAEHHGIARGARLSFDAFRAAGYQAIAHDLRPAFKQFLTGSAVLPESRGGVWFIHANAPEVIVALMAHKPRQWARMYRIGYWAWETTKAPASWLLMAEFLHEIWVPSYFVLDALAATFTAEGRKDLIGRVRVMPHPMPVVATPTAERHAHARHRFGLNPGICEVLCLFDTKSSAVRKNPWGVIDTWQRAFPNPVSHARLTLKVSDLKSDKASADRLRALVAARRDIRLMDERLSDADMVTFIGAFDILISLHRAEGFGLTLAEAMAAGVAVIATGWSGNIDFMHAGNSRLVPVRKIPVSDSEGPYTGLDRDPEQMWGEPDLWAATRALRELAESPELRYTLGQAGIKATRDIDMPWRREALAALPFNRYL